jgi:hypothetical protein
MGSSALYTEVYQRHVSVTEQSNMLMTLASLLKNSTKYLDVGAVVVAHSYLLSA